MLLNVVNLFDVVMGVFLGVLHLRKLLMSTN